MADGKAGPPLGNNNAAKGHRWQRAIEKALENKSKAAGQMALVQIAEKLVDDALEGDKYAVTEIGNRLDGKPAQAVNVGGQHDNPLAIAVTEVVMRSLDDESDE